MEESTEPKIKFNPELAKFFKDYVRGAEVAFWKLTIVLAGGALTLSIGFLLREAGQPFPKPLLPMVECAWGALLVCLGVAVAEYALSYWAMAKQARLWEDFEAGKRPFRFLRWPERVGWVMFVIAIVSLATGLVQLARVALALLTAHAV